MAKKQKAPPPTAPGPAAPEDGLHGDEAEVGYQDPLQHLQVVAVESYEKLSDAATQLTEQVHDVYKASQEIVRKNPTGYALGAFALGCVLGLLLSQD